MATGTLPDSDQDKVASSRESDELFNSTYGADVSRGIDEAERYAATGGNDSDKPLEDLENDPDTPPGGWNDNVSSGGGKQALDVKPKRWDTWKKRGPLFAIFGGIGLGGAGLLFLVIPGILLFHILANMFGTLDPSSTALTQVTKIMLMNKLGANDATVGACSTITVACRFKTPSNELLRELKSNGMTALDAKGNPIDLSTDSKWPSERPHSFRISSFATESGKEITIKASELRAALQENSALRLSFNKVVKKVGTRAFSRFSPSFLKVMNKFNFRLNDSLNVKQRVTDKGKTLLSEVFEKIFKKFGINASEAKNIVTLGISKALTRVNKVSKGSGIVLAMAAQCMANQVPGMLKKALVGVQEQAAVSVAMPVVTAISAIKVGDGDSETASELATAFNQTDSEGNSALTAAGMKYVLDGDKNTKADPTFQSVTPAVFGDLGSSLDLADAVYNNAVSSEACTLITNPVTGAAVAAGVNAAVVGSSAADFGLSFVVNWGIGTAFSLLLNQFSGAISGSLGGLLSSGVGNLAQPAVDKMSQPGQTFGNVVPFGVGVTTTNTSANTWGHYLTTSKLSAYTKSVQEQQLADAEFDRATLSPFDTSSPYTFMGSIASQMAPNYSSFSSISGSISFMGSLLPKSIGSIVQPSSAHAADMSLYENACPDTSALKVADGSGDTLAANIFCQPVAAMLVPDNWDPNQTLASIQGMKTNGVSEINEETGKATVPANAVEQTVSDTISSVTELLPGSNLSYADWLDTCSDPQNAIGCTGDDETSSTYGLYTAANTVSVMLDADQEAARTAAEPSDSSLIAQFNADTQSSESISYSSSAVDTSFSQTFASLIDLLPVVHSLVRSYGAISFNSLNTEHSTFDSLQRYTLWG